MLARRDADFRAVLNRAHLNIPDGIGLLLAARLAGDRLRQHVQGTDLVLALAAESTSCWSPTARPSRSAGSTATWAASACRSASASAAYSTTWPATRRARRP